MGMVGLRDVFVVAPAGSFHPQYHEPLPSSAEHPIIPLLTAAPCLVEEAHDGAGGRPKTAGGIHLWQPQPPLPSQNLSPNPNPTFSYLKKPVPTLDPAGILAGAGGGGATSTCQDCGNQAKKDCSHRRCRTCCKSRGFDCSTHVKSTWVPAARRRERQLAPSTAVAAAGAGSSASTSAPKKPRLISSQTTTTASHTSNSNTPPRSLDTSSSHQDASFRECLPGHVRAPAVFKCVRVTSIDDGEDEYAYHAMVKIGGHVFKGFLYDQGVDHGRGEASTSSDAIPNISELHLGGAGAAAGRNGSSSAIIPSDDYGDGPPGGGGSLGGTTHYGNPIN